MVWISLLNSLNFEANKNNDTNLFESIRNEERKFISDNEIKPRPNNINFNRL